MFVRCSMVITHKNEATVGSARALGAATSTSPSEMKTEAKMIPNRLKAFLLNLCNRNQLKSWLLRHLVECNGDADLMAKAIALHKDGDTITGVGPAAKGASGREASVSGRVRDPVCDSLPYDVTNEIISPCTYQLSIPTR